MQKNFMEEALALAAKGWPVFPLHYMLGPGACSCRNSECSSQGKHPLTAQGFKDGSTEAATIRGWWRAEPAANIGLATGAASGLVVLDIDPRHKGDESFKQMLQLHPGTWANTRTVFTGGGGIHLYFQHPGVPIRNKSKLNGWEGIDVRGDGGYVVAPPSFTGGTYKWDDDKTPMAPLPEWLLRLLTEPQRSVSAGGAGITRDEAMQGVLEGGRNHYLASLGGYLQRKGISPEALAAALHTENENKCVPPLPEWEVENIIRSVSRYNASEPVRLELGARILDAGSNIDAPALPLVLRAADLLDPMVAYLKDKDKVKGTPTCLPGLDKLFGGGKRLGEVTAWHAEAKTGKNTLWHYLMYMWLEAGIPMGYASRELTPEEEVLPNLLSLAFSENAWLAEATEAKQTQWRGKAAAWPLYFARGYGHFPQAEMEEWVKELAALGVQYFWWDHLHYMLEDPEDYKEASKLIKWLKSLAKKTKTHHDIIIQPNKLAEGEKLSLNSIKGGSAMGQAIDNLITFERMRGDGFPPNVSKLTMKAGRSKLCRDGHLYLQYNPETTQFQEVAASDVEGGVPHKPVPFDQERDPKFRTVMPSVGSGDVRRWLPKDN